MWDCLWVDADLATMAGATGFGAVRRGAIGIRDGLIEWVGPRAELPEDLSGVARRVESAGGWVLPGFIDCHTHLVFGGSRADEFARRLAGATYEEIARAGGGIVSTVRATRAASSAELREAALGRLRRLAREGVTAVEIKSGYGLDLETELTMLRVARALAAEAPCHVSTTYLGAHALPPEFAGRADDYIALVCDEVLPAVAAEGLADAVDAYCEGIGFTPAQTERVFDAARGHGLRVKLHADQLSDTGGAALAARFGALSADHLEYTSEAGVRAMAAAGTVAVLLPGAFYYLGETQLPPVAALRAHGVPIAVATDCNPGSSPIESILAVLNMACVLFGLTPVESIAGVTVHAARALGLAASRGTLEPGKVADFSIWRIDHPNELCYRLGGASPSAVIVGGERVNAS